jgi:hypothetical protein
VEFDLIDNIFGWFGEYPEILVWLGGSSILIFAFSLIGISWLVAQIPENYFLHETRHPSLWKVKAPIFRLIILIIKNILGAFLIIGGLMMLVLPGQGLLTIVTGFLFVDYPGKFKLERKMVAYPAIFNSLNWIRAKSNKAPLKI